LIKREDIVGYKKGNSFREVVLEYMLLLISKKYGFNIVKLPNKSVNKIAVDSTLDSESEEIVETFIDGDASKLKKILPSDGNFIKPLYLFLDEEVLLYAKLKNLKFKNIKKTNNKINNFLNDFEKKHPEVKRAIVNSVLELYD
jgi:tRNA(Ile)-lysidine synthase TilS/MesJ